MTPGAPPTVGILRVSTDSAADLHPLSDACVTNVGRLKAALADSSADPTQFRVLLFSFDRDRYSGRPDPISRERKNSARLVGRGRVQANIARFSSPSDFK